MRKPRTRRSDTLRCNRSLDLIQSRPHDLANLLARYGEVNNAVSNPAVCVIRGVSIIGLISSSAFNFVLVWLRLRVSEFGLRQNPVTRRRELVGYQNIESEFEEDENGRLESCRSIISTDCSVYWAYPRAQPTATAGNS